MITCQSYSGGVPLAFPLRPLVGAMITRGDGGHVGARMALRPLVGAMITQAGTVSITLDNSLRPLVGAMITAGITQQSAHERWGCDPS